MEFCQRAIGKSGNLKIEIFSDRFSFWKKLSLEKNDVIYEQGMPAFGIFFLVDGSVKLCSQSRPGVRRILSVCDVPGMMLGTDAFLYHQYGHTAITLSKSRFIFLDRSEFQDIPSIELLPISGTDDRCPSDTAKNCSWSKCKI